MKTLGEIVKTERQKKSINQKTLAKLVGVSQGVISKIEKGDIKTTTHLVKIAETLDVNPQYLQTGNEVYYGPFSDGSLKTLNYDRAIYIPIYNKAASMGYGTISEGEEIVNHIVLTKAWIKANLPQITHIENLSVIPAIGDSMSPTIESGALLFVDTGVHTVDFDGIYAISMGDRFFVKRLVFDPIRKILTISSDNPRAGKSWEINEANYEELIIHGKILMAWKPVRL